MLAVEMSRSRTTIVLTVSLLLSCTGASVLISEDAEWTTPASSAERARARGQRDARSKAQAEQGPGYLAADPIVEDAGDAPPADAATDAPEDAGPPRDAASEAEVADAGAADAAPPEASAPVNFAALCFTLCKRAIECALSGMEDNGLDPGTIDRMRETMKVATERCNVECAEEAEQERDNQEKIAAIRGCLAKDGCEEFMKCMGEMLDED